MSGTIPVGVRIQKVLLDRARAVDPDFNLSEFVRGALLKRYGNVEAEVDELLRRI